MFDRERKILKLSGREEPIEKFVVMFQTPFGLFDDLDEAMKRIIAMDYDVNACIKPVAVAVSATLYEIVG